MKKTVLFLLTGIVYTGFGQDLSQIYQKYQNSKDDRYHKEFMEKVKEIFGENRLSSKNIDHVEGDPITELRYYLKKFKDTGDHEYYKRFMEVFHKKLEKKERTKFVYRGEDKELLKLILITFLATNDLENGYLAASKGKELFPEDLYFTEKLAEISLWLGKSDESLENYLILYEKTGDEKYKKTVLDLSFALNRYEISEKILEEEMTRGDFSNWEKAVFVYENLGKPEKSIDLLEKVYEKTGSKKALKKLIYVYINTGNIDEALKRIGDIKDLSVEDSLEFSQLLYSKRKFKESLNLLKKKISEASYYNSEYWITLSDLGWGLHDYDTSFFASSVLYYTRNYRKTDLERMVIYNSYKRRFNDLSAISKVGWVRYREPFFFNYYLYSLKEQKRYEDIIKSLKNLSKQDRIRLEKESFFWTYYIESLLKLGRKDEAVEIYETAISMRPEDHYLIPGYLWLLIELKKLNKLRTSLKKWKSLSFTSKDFILAYGSGYSILQNSQSAEPYIRRLVQMYGNNPEILSLYGDILDLSGRDHEAYGYRFKAWKLFEFNRELREKYLKTYLYLALFFESGEEIKGLLRSSESKLPKKDIENLKITWNLMRGNFDKANYLLKRYADPEPWMELSISINYYDLFDQKRNLDKNLENLPIRDRVYSLENIGEIKTAESYAFYGLERNRYDSFLYLKLRDLSYTFGNKFKVTSEIYKRRDITQFLTGSSLKIEILKGIFLKASGGITSLAKNSSEEFVNLPDNMSYVELGIGGRTLKTKWKINFRESNKLKDYKSVEFFITTPLKDKFSIEISGGKNSDADETVYLYYGGMKDYVKGNILYTFTPKTFLNLIGEVSSFKAQDNESIGSGKTLTVEGIRKLRSGYPDFTVYSYIRSGIFSEKDQKGIINKISIYQNPIVLPENYYEFGSGFLFGFDNKYKYTRIWRPFFNTGLFLNTVTGLGMNFEAGAGGHIFNQDHLSFGTSYFKGVQGTTDSILRLYINYLLLF